MEIKLLEIKDLGELLGYSDLRSVKKWCAKNHLLIVRQGKKGFVSKEALDNIFERAFDTGFAKTVRQNINSRNSFKPQSDIVSKYLIKYESNNKSKAA